MVVLGRSVSWRWHVAERRRRAGRSCVRRRAGARRWRRARRRVTRLAARPRRRHGPRPRSGPRRRGRFDIAELSVRVDGPLGLAARSQRAVGADGAARPPAVPSRDEAELRIRRARILEVGLRSARGLGGGTEFEQLREYTADDEFRRVDWAASARAGQADRPHLPARAQPDRHRDARQRAADGGRVAGVPRLEHAMDAAMMLTHVATPARRRVGHGGLRRAAPRHRPAGAAPRPDRPASPRRCTSSSRRWSRATTAARSPRCWPASVGGR